MNYIFDSKRKTAKYSQYTDKKGNTHKVIHSIVEKDTDCLKDINYIYSEINSILKENPQNGMYKW